MRTPRYIVLYGLYCMAAFVHRRYRLALYMVMCVLCYTGTGLTNDILKSASKSLLEDTVSSVQWH